jgi:nicotinamide-nucleotide amidase
MAVTASARLVTVGVAGPAGPADAGVAAVVAALAEAGASLASRTAVEDDEAALEQALAGETPLTVIVASAGGSAGDVVRRVLARLTGARLVLNDRVLAALAERHRQREEPLPRREERLALLPQGATLWTDGGEPAWTLDSARGTLVVLPRDGISRAVLEPLVALARARLAGRGAVVTRTLRTAGVSVEAVEDRLAEWLGKEGDVSVATVPASGEVWVRLRARGATPAEASAALAPVEASITAILGEDCYGRDAETLEQVVGRLLVARRLTVSVAESCTGGLLGHRLTGIGGSSAYFERGVIVYSNRAKQDLLGVDEALLRAHGAVSAACAEAMARGICERSGSPCGLAITGIAGPDGGTPAKPVGTVFVALAVRDSVVARRFLFAGDRDSIKWQSTQMALDMLRRRLTE